MEQLELVELQVPVRPMVADQIKAVDKAAALLEWSPVGYGSPPMGPDPTGASICNRCGRAASTIAIQLTYQNGEPATTHYWCIRGHAWRWNEIEGRVSEQVEWMK